MYVCTCMYVCVYIYIYMDEWTVVHLASVQRVEWIVLIFCSEQSIRHRSVTGEYECSIPQNMGHSNEPPRKN
jgi:hypothetical protein